MVLCPKIASRLYLFLWAVFACLGCSESQKNKTLHSSSDYSQITANIDSIGEHLLITGKILGFSIAVMKQNDTLYQRSFGYTDAARTQPVTNQHRFKLASISKVFTATIIMKLVEEKRLSLDQTLSNLLPDFPNPEQAKKIRLYHLLSHTSGLPEYSAVIDTLYSHNKIPPGKVEFYAFFKGRDLVFEPGSHYSYCNSGYLLSGMIIERITGLDLQQEINRVINQPTGLHLELIKTAATSPTTSPYYEWNGTSLQFQPPWTWIKGDGGLTATAIELAHFPFLWSSGKIISKSSWQQMCEPFVLNDGIVTGYGLGVRNGTFEGEKVLGHTGGNYTPLSIMAWFPEQQISIVVMMNTDNTPDHVRKIFGPVAQVVMRKKFPDYIDKEVPNSELLKYEGTYYFIGFKAPKEIFVRLDKGNGHLNYQEGPNDPGKKMIYLGKGEFWIADWPYDRLIFDEDKEGRVTVLKEYYTGFYSLLRMKMNQQ